MNWNYIILGIMGVLTGFVVDEGVNLLQQIWSSTSGISWSLLYPLYVLVGLEGVCGLILVYRVTK